MTRTRAILAGPFASSPFANGLRMLLTGSGQFETIEADDHAAVGDLLVDDRPVVVIGEGIDLSWSLALLDQARDVSVVLLDDAGKLMVLAVDDPGTRRLVRLIEELTRLEGEDAERAPAARLHLVDASGAVDDAGASPDRLESVGRDLGPVTEWLDLVLGLRLLERSERASEPSFAGWTTSPSDALGGLGMDDRSADQLRGQLAEVDRSLVVDRHDLPNPLSEVARTFELGAQELRALLLAIAPDLDGRFGVAIGVLQDDLNRRRPSLTLLAELGGERGGAWRRRQELEALGSLFDRRLLAPDRRDPTVPVVEAALLPLPALVTAMAAATPDTAVRAAGARLLPRDGWGAVTSAEIRWAERLTTAIAEADGTALVRLADPGSGWFERLAPLAGLPLVVGDLTAITAGRPVDHAVAEWSFLAALEDAGLLLCGVGELTAPDHGRLGEVIRSFDGIVPAVAVDAPCPALEGDRPAIVLRRPPVGIDERIDLWGAAAASNGLELGVRDAASLASTLPLEPPEIADAVARFAVQPRDDGAPLARQLRRFAVDQQREALPPTVRSIATRFDWDDLVLADPAKAELRSIATHLMLSASVLDRWGFVDRLTYGRGVSALFSGASGTGKTMAAQILAGELGVELLLVDLSRTVSKYLGETEKNVDTAFRVAEKRGAVLLFDEADALFGKRSEVKDAHDRHANVEIAYLLQRMEAFEGIAILTTNLKQNIDDAFLRRLRFIVDFPVPDAARREAIWRRAFPDRAPLADDIDFGFLGRRLQLTGGTIQQVALHAAFAAAVDDDAIGMHHVVAATRRELDKLGMFDAGRALEGRAAQVGAA
jgi:ATPase family associated with various cellular activities (AAA)